MAPTLSFPSEAGGTTATPAVSLSVSLSFFLVAYVGVASELTAQDDMLRFADRWKETRLLCVCVGRRKKKRKEKTHGLMPTDRRGSGARGGGRRKVFFSSFLSLLCGVLGVCVSTARPQTTTKPDHSTPSLIHPVAAASAITHCFAFESFPSQCRHPPSHPTTKQTRSNCFNPCSLISIAPPRQAGSQAARQGSQVAVYQRAVPTGPKSIESDGEPRKGGVIVFWLVVGWPVTIIIIATTHHDFRLAIQITTTTTPAGGVK
jgi:hypothetical protein